MYFQKVSLCESSFADKIENQIINEETNDYDNIKEKYFNKFEKDYNEGMEEYEKHKTDKSWIASKIRALRNKYSDWMNKAQKEKDEEKAGILKRIALKIMKFVDFLLHKLQSLVSGSSKLAQSEYGASYSYGKLAAKSINNSKSNE